MHMHGLAKGYVNGHLLNRHGFKLVSLIKNHRFGSSTWCCMAILVARDSSMAAANLSFMQSVHSAHQEVIAQVWSAALVSQPMKRQHTLLYIQIEPGFADQTTLLLR